MLLSLSLSSLFLITYGSLATTTHTWDPAVGSLLWEVRSGRPHMDRARLGSIKIGSCGASDQTVLSNSCSSWRWYHTADQTDGRTALMLHRISEGKPLDSLEDRRTWRNGMSKSPFRLYRTRWVLRYRLLSPTTFVPASVGGQRSSGSGEGHGTSTSWPWRSRTPNHVGERNHKKGSDNTREDWGHANRTKHRNQNC